MDDDDDENPDVNIEDVNPEGGSDAGGGTGVAHDAEEDSGSWAEDFWRQRVMARAFRGLRPLVGVPDSGCLRGLGGAGALEPLEHYGVGRLLGRGGFDAVYAARVCVLVRRSP